MLVFDSVVKKLEDKVHRVQEALGTKLFEDYKVNITTARPGDLRATVYDHQRNFKVAIAWDDQNYRFTCSCGTAPDRVCEHVWATALTVEDGYKEDIEDYTDDPGVTYISERAYGALTGARPKSTKKKGKTPPWKKALDHLTATPSAARSDWPATRQVVYIIDREQTLAGKGITLEIASREPKLDGQLSKPKPARIGKQDLQLLPDPQDRVIVAMLAGGDSGGYGYGYYYGSEASANYRLSAPLARAVLPHMCRTGRCLLRSSLANQQYTPLAWGEDHPWQFHIEVAPELTADQYAVHGVLEREAQRRPLKDALLLTMGGLVFWPGETAVIEPLDDADAFQWILYLREHGPFAVPRADSTEFAHRLYAGNSLPRLRLPDELRLEEVRAEPVPRLKVSNPGPHDYDGRLGAVLSFDYDEQRVDATTAGRFILQPDRRRVLVRDPDRESQFHARLYQLGFRENWDYRRKQQRYGIAPAKLAKAVATLVREKWHVEADGKLYRQPGEFRIEVSSGIDWFELHGEVKFGDQVATLPKLLAALRRGESLVVLDDGTVGMLPEEWLKKYGLLAGMGKEEADHLRFARHQVGVLDALLAAQPQATCDAVFENTRRMLRTFEGIQPADPPANFTGLLRPYQRDGLGWLAFLRQFSFGGCLADDMGLGKTIQVLAMLLDRRAHRAPDGPRPSLVVVPRSLVFNWMQEASRFAPDLKLLDHSHAQRTKAGEHLSDYDVVLTTYGTLRNDAAYLKDVEFDYAILDEAQAIKNAASESAKAARLIRARHRLALSGTPVQNHLGDLWSLFEFLNPGMLGTSTVLSSAGGATRSIDDDTRNLLARALRPFILRRTKEQVAKDLPAKLEQTIFCELDATQRKLYNELKEYYRASLLDLVAKQGINKAKIQILEALLRLRQAACHPGLIDKAKVDDSSAKLDTLMPRLTEIAEEGHKALVFSQFTSFLAIVKKRLDKEKIKYEYLDGKTKDRQARVERFQSDDKCKLFLISLKAGGVGLNLTAADYVFLLDPWWNPAAEAQAIDRTHRIGQTRQVFACRLIAKDTVEEKVLALQQTKRALADAIINAENSVIGGLGRAELELLLS